MTPVAARTRSVGYTLLSLAGVRVLVEPPSSYEGLDDWLTVTMGVMLAVPALLAAFGVLAGRHRIEWVALWPLAGGTAIYGYLTLIAYVSVWGPSMVTWVAFGLSALLLARITQISGADQAARDARERDDHG